MLTDLAPVFYPSALATVACISRHATSVAVGTRSYMRLERLTAYFDDHAAQCRTVVEVGVTVGRGAGRRNKQRANPIVEIRIARLHGFDKTKDRWGDDGYTEKTHAFQDCVAHYDEAFAYTEELLSLAQSDAFAEYEKTGTYYRRH